MVVVEDRSRPRTPERIQGRPTVWWSMALVLAGSKVVFQLLTADLYGAHRDEYYYLASGNHLAFGYVDNPPLVPWIYRAEQAVLGHSVTSLAVAPALLGGVLVMLGVLITADLGGGRAAQTLTGVVAWLGPLFLTTTHFLGTVSIDLVVWAFASWLVIRIVTTGDTRLWVAVGGVVGVGLLNKYSVLFWVLGAGVGLLLSRERRVLWSWWLPVGAGLAAVIVLPNVVWETSHHWPTLEFLRNLRSDNATSDYLQFAPVQLVLATIGGTVLWIVALFALLRRREWRPQIWLAYGYGVAFALILALGGKAYYLGPWYLPLIAVGAVVVETGWPRAWVRLLVLVIVVTGVLFAPLATPVVSQATAVHAHLDTKNKDLGGMLGWPTVVADIASVVHRLPPGSRHHVVIFTSDYSEAGAVDYYGPAFGLPGAISGHNTFWLWGYGHPAPGAPVVAVGLPGPYLHRYWSSVVRASTLGASGSPIDPQERGVAIWICTGQRASWAAIWPTARHYD